MAAGEDQRSRALKNIGVGARLVLRFVQPKYGAADADRGVYKVARMDAPGSARDAKSKLARFLSEFGRGGFELLCEPSKLLQSCLELLVPIRRWDKAEVPYEAADGSGLPRHPIDDVVADASRCHELVYFRDTANQWFEMQLFVARLSGAMSQDRPPLPQKRPIR